MLIVSLTGECLRRTVLSFCAPVYTFSALKTRPVLVILPVVELVDSGDLNLGLMCLLYIIVSFSLLGMWGYAEYCRLASDRFWLYIYMRWCS